MLQAFLLVNVFVPYLYSLSYVALGLVVMPRAPWLATLGIMSGWLGSAPWGLVTGQSFLLSDMARSGHDAVATDLLQRFNTHPETLVMATAWIFGHLLGYVLLGLALVRARVVPRWAGYLMVIAAPVMGPLAYGTNQGNLQVLGYLLVFGASVPVGAVLLSPRRTVRPEAEANG